MTDRAKYLEPSPFETDGGELIGKYPRLISAPDLRALGHPASPIKAIRAKCVDCCGGHMAEVRKCVSYSCPLWPMRMGRSPFHGRAKEAAE
jgi:hypothetical protein